MCEYFLSCANYRNDCSCDSCKHYVILEKYIKDKFKKFLKELKVANLLEYRPVQAAIILTKERLDNGINITNFDIQIPRDNPIWYDISVSFDNQTALNAYQDDFAEDKFQGICSITDYNIDDILMR